MDSSVLPQSINSLAIDEQSSEQALWPKLPGYHSISLLCQIRNISLYRAFSPSGQKVVLKCPTNLEATEVSRSLRHEWEMFLIWSSLAKGSGILKPWTCEELEDSSYLALVYPDDGLQPLAHIYKSGEITALPVSAILRLLRVIASVVKILDLLHTKDIVHGSISTWTIFLTSPSPRRPALSVTSSPVQSRTSTVLLPPTASSPITSPGLLPLGQAMENEDNSRVLLGGLNTAVCSNAPETIKNSMASGYSMTSRNSTISQNEGASRGSRSSSGQSLGSENYFDLLRSSNVIPKCFTEVGCLWEYKAPEFSGRLNRGVDWRGDYYALGVVMYELLVGRLPFESSDGANLIYKHIAEIPKPPSDVNFSIPVALSEIVLKLLAKNPEARYQTASGILADLEYVVSYLIRDSSMHGFQVGLTDTNSQFVLSDHLYGRQHDLGRLFELFDSIIEVGGCQTVLISGKSGVGKSRLVHEMRSHVMEKGGYFTAGKFDQYRRGQPFLSLIQCVQALIRQVLSESEMSLRRWKTDTIRAIGGEASLLIEVIPEVKLLLGSDYIITPINSRGHAERQVRFASVFCEFLGIFTRKGLVIFLDDLQWCTVSDFRIILNIVSEMKTSAGLLLVCGYRNDEINDSHPLPAMIESLKRRSRDLIEMNLGNLDSESVHKIVLDALRKPASDNNTEAAALVQLLLFKTCGNVFFVIQLLKGLHRDGHIYFDFTKREWKFSLAAIDSDDVPPSVVDLLLKQMLALGGKTRYMLAVAACMGTSRLTFQLLSIISAVSIKDVSACLWSAFDAGFLVSIEEGHQLMESTASTVRSVLISKSDSNVCFRFLHDRVQQAAYSLVSRTEQRELHRKIGQRLIQYCSDPKLLHDNIYDIVNQLNHSLEDLHEDERMDLLLFNLQAGRKALDATAYIPALNYMNISHSLLLSDSWVRSYSLTLKVMTALIEVHFAINKYSETVEMVDSCLPHILDPKEKVIVMLHKLNGLQAMGRYRDTIYTGLEMIALLKFDMPKTPNERDEMASVLAKRIEVSIASIKLLDTVTLTTDENIQLLQQIIGIILLPIYMSSPEWLKFACYLSVVHSLDSGFSIDGAFPILMAGVVLSKEPGTVNARRGFEYGKVAISIIEQSHVQTRTAAAVYEVFAGHLCVFQQPMNDVLNYFQKAISVGLSTYDVDYTTFASVEISCFSLFAGEDLASVQSNLQTSQPLIKRLNSSVGMIWHNCISRMLLSIRGPSKSGTENDIAAGPSLKSDSGEQKSDSLSTLYLIYFYELVTSIILGKEKFVSEALELKMESLTTSMIGTFYLALGDFYGAVVFLNMSNLSATQQRILKRGLANIRSYAKSCPSTFGHKAKLLEAEISKAKGSDIHTMDLFDDCIKMAMRYNFIHDAAFYCERCGKWLESVSPARALHYLKEAHHLYSLWGADVKAAQLMITPRQWFYNQTSDAIMAPKQFLSDDSMSPLHRASALGSPAPNLLSPRSVEDALDVISPNQAKTAFMSSDIDLKTVLKASLVISKGSKVEDIVVSLVGSVLQAAGADYGVLLIEEGQSLFLEAVGMADGVTLLDHEPLTPSTDSVPLSIINIVAGLGETIVKQEEFDFDSVYGNDTYFSNKRIKSILCMPIANQLRFMGVLYLENKNTSHAFSGQRLELLNLLCNQAAVTIEKTRLYRQMELAKKAAEDATAEKSSFLANMSHEIRTPFNALLSCSIFLLDTKLSSTQRNYVETIRSSATLTLDIIDGILDYSKIEYGKSELACAPFSLKDCIECALQLIAEPAATKSLELAFRNRLGDAEVIYGDLTRFRQIIINLLGNAVKFTSEGHILVEASSEKFAGNDGRYQVKVSVIDTGIGIPRDAFDRLFRAFSQVDSSSRRAHGGTGLGLVISKKLVEMMGGKMWVESEESKGTSFHLTIICQALPNQLHRPDPDLQDLSCIIAGANSHATKSLRDELRREGMKVETGHDFAQIVHTITANKPGTFKLAFVDMSIDENLKFPSEIHKRDASVRIVVLGRFGIAMPNYDDISGYLMKPIQSSRLLQTIKAALNSASDESYKDCQIVKEDQSSLLTLARNYPLKILLAEDNAINRKVALQHLKRMGYIADHAKDGIEALEKCEVANPMYDVILMDIQMPRSDGIETTLEIKRRYNAILRPEIIALTANAAQTDRAACLKAGMITHVSKPILPKDLAMALMGVVPLAKRTQD